MRLVYFSPVRWLSYAQRPHKFVEWWRSRRNGQVLWVEPYPTRLPMLVDFRQVGGRERRVPEATAEVDIPEWLDVLRPQALPIEPLPGARMINRLMWSGCLAEIEAFIRDRASLIAVGKPSAMALQALDTMAEVPSLYDAMDDFPAFYRGISCWTMKRTEAAIASRVSALWVSSGHLAARFSQFQTKLRIIRNACTVDSLTPVRPKTRVRGRPILGYVGTIGHWFDWSWIERLANENPAMCIRLIGPRYVSPPGTMPDNVELQPACPHPAAIRAMEEFSVGLIPFKRTPLTASVDPIKYYEYRALGLPVISTRFGEMGTREGQSGVFIADEDSDLMEMVEAALACEGDVAEIQRFRDENSWQTRFDAGGLFCRTAIA